MKNNEALIDGNRKDLLPNQRAGHHLDSNSVNYIANAGCNILWCSTTHPSHASMMGFSAPSCLWQTHCSGSFFFTRFHGACPLFHTPHFTNSNAVLKRFTCKRTLLWNSLHALLHLKSDRYLISLCFYTFVIKPSQRLSRRRNVKCMGSSG